MLSLPWGARGPGRGAAVRMLPPQRCSGRMVHVPWAVLWLRRWQAAQRRFYLCASRHLHVLTDRDVTWRTVCACALRARCSGYRTQPRLLHVPGPICMQNTLFSPSVLACSAFLREQMCSFSCPFHIPCPVHCPANHFCASKHCFFPPCPWPLLRPELVSQWHFRTLVNRTG